LIASDQQEVAWLTWELIQAGAQEREG
jgi:hypothetical protein